MSVPNFIGFQPAEFNEDMKTLKNVIKLQSQLRDDVEKARGYESNLAKDNERRAKPINDEIAKQNSLLLTYSSAKDIADAKFQVSESKKLKDAADAQAAATNDLGDAELAAVYGLQLDYARSKLKYLESIRDLLKAKTPKERADRMKKVDDNTETLQDSLNLFTTANIPAGFIQAVDVRSVPAQPQAQLGAPQGQVVVAQQGQQQPAAIPLAPPIPKTQTKIKVVKPKAFEKIQKMYNSQNPPRGITLGPQADIVLFIAKTGAPGIVGIWDINQGDEDYANYDPNQGGFVFSKAPGYPVDPKMMLKLLENDYDNMSQDELRTLVALYFSVFPNERIYFRSPMDVGTTKKGDWLFDDNHPLIVLIRNNKYKDDVQSELAPTGSGIFGDLIKKASRTVAKAISPKMPGKRGPPMKRPKLMGDMFGNVRVDLPALHNQRRIRAYQGGKIVMDETEEEIDGFGLRRLMMTRVMQKTLDSAPPKVRKQYDRLLKLANSEQQISGTSGKGVKKQAKPQIVLVGNGDDLAQRLKIAVGEYSAGNDSSENIQLITELAHRMLKLGKISAERYKQIVESIA